MYIFEIETGLLEHRCLAMNKFPHFRDRSESDEDTSIDYGKSKDRRKGMYDAA